MTRRPVRQLIFVFAAVLVAGLVPAGPTATAWAADGQGAAFVWSFDPSTPIGMPYTPYGPYQYNSASPGNPDNTVTRLATGRYWVRIPHLVGFGAPHSTAYGGDAAYCNSGDTVGSTGALVDVECFTAAGKPVDERFMLSFTNVTDAAQAPALAYLEVESDGSVWGSRQFNSAGGLTTVSRVGSDYVVRIPGLGAHAGHVEVSGADGQGSRCKVVGWGPDGDDQEITVRCWQAGSYQIPADAPFILTFVDQQNILGLPTDATPGGHASAYAWADQMWDASYPPDSWYLFDSDGPGATATRTGVGVYGISFDGADMATGDVQVTAYGPGQQFCVVAQWIVDIQVRCFDWDGTPADSQYTVTFTGT